MAAFSYTNMSFKCIFNRLVEENLPYCIHMASQGSFMHKIYFTILISAPENPNTPIDCSSISYILRIAYHAILAKGFWNTFKKLLNYSLLRISITTPSRNTLSPKTNVGLFLRHLALLCTKNFSVSACTSKNQHCLGGRRDKCFIKNKNMKCPRTFSEF